MADDEDWLWRPMQHHYCKYESYFDGTLRLLDIARMNELIDLENENRMRVQDWANSNGN